MTQQIAYTPSPNEWFAAWAIAVLIFSAFLGLCHRWAELEAIEDERKRIELEARWEAQRQIWHESRITEVETCFAGQPVACTGCKHYHGVAYPDAVLICAIHPYGPPESSCPDWETWIKEASREQCG